MPTDYGGIYKLTLSQTKDILYDRNAAPVNVTNLKIPNPTIKTGFVPSGSGKRRSRRRRKL